MQNFPEILRAFAGRDVLLCTAWCEDVWEMLQRFSFYTVGGRPRARGQFCGKKSDSRASVLVGAGGRRVAAGESIRCIIGRRFLRF